MPGPTYRALPRVGTYQTRQQRINRLETLADAERQRLQTQFRQQANLAAQDLGRAQGLHDRFQPPPQFRPSPSPTGQFLDLFSDVAGPFTGKAPETSGTSGLTFRTQPILGRPGWPVQPEGPDSGAGTFDVVGALRTPSEALLSTAGTAAKEIGQRTDPFAAAGLQAISRAGSLGGPALGPGPSYRKPVGEIGRA